MRDVRYRVRLLRRLWPYMKKVWPMIIVCLLLNLTSVVLNFIVPLIYRDFINNVILNIQIDYLITIIISYFLVFVLGAVISHLLLYVNYKWQNKVMVEIRETIFNGYMARQINEYESIEGSSVKMSIDDDPDYIKQFIRNQGIQHIIQYLCLLFSLAIMIVMSWKLALFALLAIPITIIIDMRLGKKEGKITEKNRDNNQNMYEWLCVSLSGWKELKVFNAEKRQLDEFEKYHKKFSNYYCKWINYWTARVLVIPAIKNDFLMKLCLYFFGGMLIIGGQFRIGDLLVFMVYYEILSKAIQTISSNNADLQACKPIIERVVHMLDESEQILCLDKKLTGKYNCNAYNVVSLKNVCFKYQTMREMLICDFNLSVKRGERVGIVGKSGCGKSTLLKLIIGMVLPDSGTIEISGVNISRVNSTYIYDHVGVVMQDSTLLNASVRRNLLLAKENATDDEIARVCEQVDMAKTIEGLPQGIDTVIGDNGVKLSGGQRQRLCIARVLLRDVDLYCFDESTSALDEESEKAVYNAIKCIPKDKTILLITHRESLLKMCNRVINLESGVNQIREKASGEEF